MRLLYALPATCALIYRAKSRNSLTPAGIFAATLTAIAHAYHPWNLPFALLCVFFLAGTRVTHIKENIKSNYTLRSKGTSGGEGPRTHVQGKHLGLFAASQIADILCSPRQQFDGLCSLPPSRTPATETRSRIRRSQYPGPYGITMLLLGR
jgi:uncharacterized membrane protein